MSCYCKSHARTLINDQHEGHRLREEPQKDKRHLVNLKQMLNALKGKSLQPMLNSRRIQNETTPDL